MANDEWYQGNDVGDFFRVSYCVKEWILRKKSKYQQIDIFENELFGRMLFLDRELQIASADAVVYDKAIIDPLAKKKIKKALILGGGDGGTLRELLLHNPANVTVVDIDEDVIKAAKEFLKPICEGAFDDKRVDIVIQDANTFLDEDHAFDAIVYDLTLHPWDTTETDQETFLRNMFAKMRKNLVKGGLLTMQCCQETNKTVMPLVKKLLQEEFKNISFNAVFVPAYCERWVFVSAEAK